MSYPIPAQTPKLVRSRDNAWIGGVCGGIAARFGWDASIVRALFAVSILLPGPQVLLYLLLWLVIPREPVAGSGPITYPKAS